MAVLLSLRGSVPTILITFFQSGAKGDSIEDSQEIDRDESSYLKTNPFIFFIRRFDGMWESTCQSSLLII